MGKINANTISIYTVLLFLLAVIPVSGCVKKQPPLPLGSTGYTRDNFPEAWNIQAEKMSLPLLEDKNIYRTGDTSRDKNSPSSSIRNYTLVPGFTTVVLPSKNEAGERVFKEVQIRNPKVRLYIYASDKRGVEAGKRFSMYDVWLVGIEFNGDSEYFKSVLPSYTSALINALTSKMSDIDTDALLKSLDLTGVIAGDLDSSSVTLDDLTFTVEYRQNMKVLGRTNDGKMIVRKYRRSDAISIVCRFTY